MFLYARASLFEMDVARRDSLEIRNLLTQKAGQREAAKGDLGGKPRFRGEFQRARVFMARCRLELVAVDSLIAPAFVVCVRGSFFFGTANLAMGFLCFALAPLINL